MREVMLSPGSTRMSSPVTPYALPPGSVKKYCACMYHVSKKLPLHSYVDGLQESQQFPRMSCGTNWCVVPSGHHLCKSQYW